jgi:uroporphyrin-III C-methyltransferase
MPDRTNNQNGYVVLAGAGPGDPELITLKLAKALQKADVILADRLVNPRIWVEHAPADVLLIQAGKQGYNCSSLTQEQVTALLLHHAKQGKYVVRLKGGDVAFFSNVLDELEAMVEHQIPYEIIPGVTAASGASAYAGIPLTARAHAQTVQFLSFNPTAIYTDAYWQLLADNQDTTVLYMAGKNLAIYLDKLLELNADPHLPIAVIEQATTEHQQVHISTLGEAKKDLLTKKFSSPSLVITGKVVALHHRFTWFQGKKKGSVFLNLSAS